MDKATFTESKHIGIVRIRDEARLRYNPLNNLTPQKITRAMDNFECGYLSDAAKIYEAIRRRDGVVQACIQKRKSMSGLLRASGRGGRQGNSRRRRQNAIRKSKKPLSSGKRNLCEH